LVINQATATVLFPNATIINGTLTETDTYSGSPLTATVSTNPAVQAITVTYQLGSASPTTVAPTAVGTYTVVATVADPNYQGTSSEQLVINQATATVTFPDATNNITTVTYNGSAQPVTVSTTPTGLKVTVTYQLGSASPTTVAPSAVGSYAVVATVNDPSYQGTASETLIISSSTNFGGWENSYNFTGGPTETPENDGIPNLMKYVFDIDPTGPMTAADIAALPTLGTTTIDGTDYLTLTFREYKSLTGVNVILETSTDLQNWTPVTGPSLLSQPVGAPDANGDSTVEMGVPVNGTNKQFIRLNVVMP